MKRRIGYRRIVRGSQERHGQLFILYPHPGVFSPECIDYSLINLDIYTRISYILKLIVIYESASENRCLTCMCAAFTRKYHCTYGTFGTIIDEYT